MAELVMIVLLYQKMIKVEYSYIFFSDVQCSKLWKKIVAMIEGSIKHPRKNSALRTDSINKFIKDWKVVIGGISDTLLKFLKPGSYYDKTKVIVRNNIGWICIALKMFNFIHFINDANDVMSGCKRNMHNNTKWKWRKILIL